tara:strand:- start:1104 stop:1466 length:363 start_codon:yes stop_codon:yes gene_type:complete
MKKKKRINRDSDEWYYIKSREDLVIEYKQVVCRDGFRMSVQAGVTMYSMPRKNNAMRYKEVEVGYPSSKESLILEYAENPKAPTDTVYAYVPAEIVTLVIAKHGGLVSGDVPPGVIVLPA